MSIFSGIPIENLDKRKHVLFNALDFAMSQAEKRYIPIANDLLRKPIERQTDSVSLAWDFIDWSDRIRKLLGHGAGLKKRDPWFKEFKAVLNEVEEARHFIQHFDKSINTYLEESIPPLGYVTGIVATKDGIFSVGDTAGSFYIEGGVPFQFNVGVVPEKVEPPIDSIHLHIGNEQVNLTQTYKAIVKAKHNFYEFVKREYGR